MRIRVSLASLLFAILGCRVDYECRDACAKVYGECGSAVAVDGVELEREQCELVCEEGRADPGGAASRWLDCVQDSVCPGETAGEEERDLERYDVDWCAPRFDVLVVPG